MLVQKKSESYFDIIDLDQTFFTDSIYIDYIIQSKFEVVQCIFTLHNIT